MASKHGKRAPEMPVRQRLAPRPIMDVLIEALMARNGLMELEEDIRSMFLPPRNFDEDLEMIQDVEDFDDDDLSMDLNLEPDPLDEFGLDLEDDNWLDIVPHGFDAEDDAVEKSARRSLYERKKVNSHRFNTKEQRRKRNRIVQQWVREAEQLKASQVENVPQADSGVFDFVGEIGKIVRSMDVSDFDTVLMHAERAALLSQDLGQCTSLPGLVPCFLRYICMYSKHSLTYNAEALYTVLLEEYGGVELEPQGFSFSGRALLDSWEMIKQHAIFKKIAFLISVAMSSSVCAVKEINWSIGDVRFLHLEALKEQVKTENLLDCIISTFVWMVETGQACFQERSLAPILYSDQRVAKYIEDCNELLALGDSAKAGNHPDLPDYRRKLSEAIMTTAKMQKVVSSTAMKDKLQQRYVALVGIEEDLIAKGKNTAFRFCPAGIKIYGDSSIGKSNLAELTMKTGLSAMGFSTSKEGIITLNECDKYDSTYTTDVQGVFIDDAANSKSSFVEKSPTQKYIQLFNNVSATAVKAELNEKGRVFIEFKLGVVTTNVEDLDARMYSNFPAAILRRFIHVKARVKSKYCMPGSTMLNPDHPEIVNTPENEVLDVWELDIFRYVPNVGYVPYDVKIGNTVRQSRDLDLHEYLLAVTEILRSHAQKQHKEVARNKTLEQSCNCPQCNLPGCVKNPHCTIHPQGIVGDLLDCASALTTFKKMFSKYLFPIDPVMDLCSTREIREYLDAAVERRRPMVLGLLPDSVWNASLVQALANRYSRYACRSDYLKIQTMCWSIFRLMLVPMALLGWPWLLLLCLSYAVCIWHCEAMIRPQVEILRARLNDERALYLDYGRQLRSKSKRVAVAGLILGSVCLALRMWYKSYKHHTHAVEGSVSEQDSSPGWFGFYLNKMVFQAKEYDIAPTGNPEALIRTSRRNCGWAEFSSASFPKPLSCGIVFPRKSVACFPEHMLYPSADMSKPRASLVHVNATIGPGKGIPVQFVVDPDMCYYPPDSDLVFARVMNCPDVPTLDKHFLPEHPKGSCLAHFVAASKDRSAEVSPISPSFGWKSHKFRNFWGASYTTQQAKKGACMSLIVSERVRPAILGFHIGGNEITHQGVCLTLTQDILADAYACLENLDGPLSARAGEFPETQYGVPVLSSPTPHAKSYANQLTEEHCVEPLGATRVRSEQKGNVVPSILKKDVTEVFGFDKEYASPDLKPNWVHFNKNIDVFSKPVKMFPPKLLKWAADDWLEGLLPKAEKYARDGHLARPLTLKEAIIGIPGMKYIDAMPMDTGMGFPVFGKKNKVDVDGNFLHFEEIRDGEQLVDRIPKPHVQEEFERLISCWERNERAYPITTATLKDEPTPIEKKKVRVFQAAPVAMSIAIRMYFLPIARFLHMHSLTAETAVGVNSFSQDWEVLTSASTKFAEEEQGAIAWDYKNYDVSMNSQLTRTVWETWIVLARKLGYPERALNIMSAMIVDICHPAMDINGTMYMAFSMNTSGNNMTVDVNGTAGSILVRMGFKDTYPECENFRDCVSMMTYGDDLIGSVREEYRKFNFVSYKRFLAEHNMIITLPDKSDREIEFVEAGELDFLKRQSNYIPEIGCSIGKLDEKSIFKPLVANVKSKSVTPREQAASCVETALHEWFAYGREHYEMRRAQMREICERNGLVVEALNNTFDDRVAHWKKKYQS